MAELTRDQIEEARQALLIATNNNPCANALCDLALRGLDDAEDAERFVWYFRDGREGNIESSKEIIELHLKQLSGEGVTLQQWRTAIDAARKEQGHE